MHFLMIDHRFGVPIFVFLECDPSNDEGCPSQRGRWVTLEPVAPRLHPMGRPNHGIASMASIGADPDRLDCYAEFASDSLVHAAG